MNDLKKWNSKKNAIWKSEYFLFKTPTFLYWLFLCYLLSKDFFFRIYSFMAFLSAYQRGLNVNKNIFYTWTLN